MALWAVCRSGDVLGGDVIRKDDAMKRMADWENPDYQITVEEWRDALFWLSMGRAHDFMGSLSYRQLQDKAMVRDGVKAIVEDINEKRFKGLVPPEVTGSIRGSLTSYLRTDYMTARLNEEKKLERMRDAARLRKKGYDVRTIADALDVTEATVRKYLKSIDDEGIFE